MSTAYQINPKEHNRMTQAELFAKVLVLRPLTVSLPRGYGHAKYRIIGADSGTWRDTRDALKIYFRIEEGGRPVIAAPPSSDCLMLVVERIGGYSGPVPAEESFECVIKGLG